MIIIRKKTKRTINIAKHAFIYSLFAFWFILMAFGLEALLRDFFFKSRVMALVAVIVGIIGTVITFLIMKGRVKWT